MMLGVSSYLRKYLGLIAKGWLIPGAIVGVLLFLFSGKYLGFFLGFFSALLGSFLGVTAIFIPDILKRVYIHKNHSLLSFNLRQKVLFKLPSNYNFDSIDFSVLLECSIINKESFMFKKNHATFLTNKRSGRCEKVSIRAIDYPKERCLEIISEPVSDKIIYDFARNLENVCLVKKLLGLNDFKYKHIS